MTAISVVPAAVWHEVVSLVSNFIIWLFDLIIGAMKLCNAKAPVSGEMMFKV